MGGHPAGVTQSKTPDFRRVDYLTYDRLQGRWQYVSMDTRATIGLMFARGYGADREDELRPSHDALGARKI